MPKLTARRKRAAAPAPEAAFTLPPSEVVGISAAGKSTLVQALRQLGYDAKPISQEHSYIPTLWRQFSLAHLLLFLDNDLAGQRRRRPDVTWTADELAAEQTMLADAREHADLRINTAELTAEQVVAIAVAFLESRAIRRSPHPLPPVLATGSALPDARYTGSAPDDI
jgi:hypothetical protein